MSDERVPAKCPSCQGEWTLTDNDKRLYIENLLVCPNFDICRFQIVRNGGSDFLIKYEEDGSEIWWWNKQVELKLIGKGFRKIDFPVPYDMTVERLKTLLPFA